ncbi:hypothetical protein J6590_061205 [Homalodisca vitripennis]|nr:hypothetical protein J6590_061205 [Homalodisca vitripennis]
MVSHQVTFLLYGRALLWLSQANILRYIPQRGRYRQEVAAHFAHFLSRDLGLSRHSFFLPPSHEHYTIGT